MLTFILIFAILFVISLIINITPLRNNGWISSAVLVLAAVIVAIIFRDELNNWINGIFAWINDITGGLFLDTLNGKNTVGAILKIIADVFIFGFIIFAILHFFILKPKSNVDNESEEFDFDDEDFEEREEQEERNDCEPSEKK